MSLDEYGDNSEGETLADANRRKLNWLEEHFADQIEELEEDISDLEAENTQLRRKVAELKNGGVF